MIGFLISVLKIVILLGFLVFIHELGHLITGIIVGMKPEKIEIMPFGVSISFKIKVEEYNKKIKKGNMLEIKKILVALAGPLTNFIIIIIASNINIDLFKALIIIYTNFLIMIFNLLPIYPLDGGRILKGILHINFGIQKSEFYTNIISKITVTIITILSSVLILYIHNIAIALIDMYLWYLVIKEDIIYKKREKILENINQKTLENETNS